MGLTSLALTFLNWLWLVFVFALARVKSGLGSDINMRISASFDVWAPISFMLVVTAFFLGFTLKKSARVQAVAAGTLMIAVWLVGYLCGRN